MNMTKFYASTAVVAKKGIGEVDGVKFSHDDVGDCYLYMNEEVKTN